MSYIGLLTYTRQSHASVEPMCVVISQLNIFTCMFSSLLLILTTHDIKAGTQEVLKHFGM